MPTQGLEAAAPKSTSPTAPSTLATRQTGSKNGKAAVAAREKEALSQVPRITRAKTNIALATTNDTPTHSCPPIHATRSHAGRAVPPIPTGAHILHPATPAAPQETGISATSSPHRPAPQFTLRDLSGDISAASLFSDALPSTSVGNPKKRAKKIRPRDAAKREEFMKLSERIRDEDETNSLDSLATVFAEVVALMKGYKTSAPILANWEALDAITERLVNHHAFPRTGDDKEAFGAIVTRSVSAPVKELATKLESQSKAIISLTKTVESLRKAAVSTDQLAHKASPKSAKSYAAATSKSPAPPIPNPSDERILVRFDGEVPELVHEPYHEILRKLNAHLASMHLPELVYTQRQSGSSIFIVPKTKEDLTLLSQRWSEWSPAVLPGGRIAPVAEHCYLQVNGIPFRAVDSLDSTAREFEERNPALGKVLSITWVNRPPSEAKVAAIAARGLKPPTAGSLFIRLQSRDSVDRAVATGRVILGGMAPTVQRGFPHLRICQCWGCLKFGHTRSRCGVKTERCGGCGKGAHGSPCTERPNCINCGEAHRSDSLSCPARKRIAAQLNQRAADISRALDDASIHNKNRPGSAPVSPLSASSTLFEMPRPIDTPPLAPRLHERP
ncbi:hypothetical protein C8F04DRAFT_1263499 [Mycena alexandri]|uniref:Gag-like protein n=1 Tax=Mycena alexandri TaxID=1745969 RepID=A0AAD6SMW2_9AGAR|nr:hypothetical protein C8F04DRAFT_1263499 [Mycena alexandri]